MKWRRPVKYYSWKKIFLFLILYPKLFITFLRLPRQYNSLDQWLEIDEIKCVIIAKAIRCKCANVLYEQQCRNMEFRKSVSSSFAEWMIKRGRDPSLSDSITAISKKFAIQEKCHRQYRPPRAGVYCYCRVPEH